MSAPVPLPIVHAAPTMRDGAVALSVIDPASPDARGGQLLVTEATLRQLPDLISAALQRFDLQRAPRGEG